MASADQDEDQEQTAPSTAPPADDLDERIRRIVGELVDAKMAGVGAPAGGDTGKPQTQRQVEADMEAQVRGAIDKVEGEKAKEGVVAQLQQEIADLKAAVEQRPRLALNRVQRFLWGGPDD
jgi:hypothetical protein